MAHITYTTRRCLGLCQRCLTPLPGRTRCALCKRQRRAKALAGQKGISLEQALRRVREREKAKQARWRAREEPIRP